MGNRERDSRLVNRGSDKMGGRVLRGEPVAVRSLLFQQESVGIRLIRGIRVPFLSVITKWLGTEAHAIPRHPQPSIPNPTFTISYSLLSPEHGQRVRTLLHRQPVQDQAKL